MVKKALGIIALATAATGISGTAHADVTVAPVVAPVVAPYVAPVVAPNVEPEVEVAS